MAEPTTTAPAALVVASAAQQRASNPLAQVWVSASAGSGKTKVLTDRILRLLQAGAAPERILCLTFTKAGAGEMANRLAEKLRDWATAENENLHQELLKLTGIPPEPEDLQRARQLFAQVLDCAGGLRIQTIHGFCQSILGRFPLEAGLSPGFTVLDERAATQVLDECRQALLTLAATGRDAGLLAAVNVLASATDEGGLNKILKMILAQRRQLEPLLLHGGLSVVQAQLWQELGLPANSKAEDIKQNAKAGIDLSALYSALPLLAKGGKKDQAFAAALQEILQQTDFDFSRYRALWFTQKGELRKMPSTKALETEPAVIDFIASEQQRLQAIDEQLARLLCGQRTAATLNLAAHLLGDYQQRKHRQGWLDYDDLIFTTCRLMTTPGRSAWVLYKLDGGLDHILIDEAQDTSPQQWQVVRALVEEFFDSDSLARNALPRSLFVVGDEKQSIYSFQGADPAAFAEMRALFAQRVQAAQQNWAEVPLTVSFRSTSMVLKVVDAVFAQEFMREGVSSSEVVHQAAREGQAGSIELWSPITPLAKEQFDAWDVPSAQVYTAKPEQRLAQLIAQRIKSWLDEGQVLTSSARAIQAGDIMILLRTRNKLYNELVRALKAANVPLAGIDRMTLTQPLAVQDILAYLKFLLLPEDDLNLAALLKSPLLGMAEDALMALAIDRRGSLWQALKTDVRHKAMAVWLEAAQQRILQSGLYAHLAQLLAAPCPGATALQVSSARAALLTRLGADASDPLDELLEAAQNFEQQHAASLQGFVRWLEVDDSEIKREQEKAGGLVRLLTVHGAKGLQAPIVILPDACGKLEGRVESSFFEGDAGSVPLLYLGADATPALLQQRRRAAQAKALAEERRLLYVALTRAEDRLYLAGYHGDKEMPQQCWYQWVAPIVKGFCEKISASEPEQQLGLTDIWRAEDAQIKEASNKPAKDNKPILSTPAKPADLPLWAQQPAPAEPSPSRPLAPSHLGSAPPVRSPLQAPESLRFLRGQLLHRLLQTLPDLPEAQREAAAQNYLASATHRLSATQQTALLREAMHILQQPQFAALFGGNSLAEVPISGCIGHLVLAGQIDRLVVTSDAVHLIDYKTNRPAAQSLDDVPRVYLRQLALYRAVLRQIYADKLVRCTLLYTDGGIWLDIPETKLEEALQNWLLEAS